MLKAPEVGRMLGISARAVYDLADAGCLYTQAAIDAAVAAERERCAKLCEDIGDGYQAREAYKWAELRSDAQTGAHDCAAAIRQAGEKT